MYMYYFPLILFISFCYCNIHADKNSRGQSNNVKNISGYVGIGYDLLLGNPFGDATMQNDYGYRNTVILQPNIKIDEMGNVYLQDYNKSYWIRKNSYCWQNNEPDNISTKEDYLKELYNDFEIDNALGSNLLKANTSNNIKTITKNIQSVYKIMKSYCIIYESGMILPYSGKLSTHFIDAMSKLPNTIDDVSECPVDVYISNNNNSKCQNTDIWMKFFSIYGTHFASYVVIGGKIIDIEGWTDVRNKNIENSSVTHNNSHTIHKFEKDIKGRKTSKRVWVIGGYFTRGLENKNDKTFSLWSKSLIKRPMPIKARFRMLSQFFPDKHDTYIKAMNYYSNVIGLRTNTLETDTIDQLFNDSYDMISNMGTIFCPNDTYVLAGFVIEKVNNKLNIRDCIKGRDICIGNTSTISPSIWLLCGMNSINNIVTIASKDEHIKCPLDFSISLGISLGFDKDNYDLKLCENSCNAVEYKNRISWMMCVPQQEINWKVDIVMGKVHKGREFTTKCPPNYKILKGFTLKFERLTLDKIINISISMCYKGLTNCKSSCKYDQCRLSITILICME